MAKKPSKERGCSGKINLGLSSFKEQADRLSLKNKKKYGVYLCPYCMGTHLTTKLEKRGIYEELLYITK